MSSSGLQSCGGQSEIVLLEFISTYLGGLQNRGHHPIAVFLCTTFRVNRLDLGPVFFVSVFLSNHIK